MLCAVRFRCGVVAVLVAAATCIEIRATSYECIPLILHVVPCFLTTFALTCRLFACLVMASKVWDDLSMWNVVSGVSAVSSHRLVLSGDRAVRCCIPWFEETSRSGCSSCLLFLLRSAYSCVLVPLFL
jgi:hypothetical protein